MADLSLKSQLLEMGFPEVRVLKSLQSAKNLEQAINWIVAHESDKDIDVPSELLASESTESTCELVTNDDNMDSVKEEGAVGGGEAQAMSLKCNDCGKLLKDSTQAQVHAERSGHVNFGESTEVIKPLTEEEKKQKAAELQALIKKKQAEKAEQERKEEIEKEKLRRVEGQGLAEIKQKMAEKEMREIAADRKRQKIEDAKAKQRILDQIQADREARRQKASGEQAAPAAAAKPTTVAPPPQQNYDEARLQIRLTDGKCLTHTFQAQESLAAVRLYIQLNRTDGEGNFCLMTPFPRKVFTDEDMDAPLKELGLVPSAVLVASKIE